MGKFHNKKQNDSQKGDRIQKYHGQLGIDHKRHCHSTNQRQWSTHTHPQHHLIGILYIRHIRHQASHQTGCRKFIDIMKREILNIVEHCSAQILGKACRCISCIFPRHRPAEQGAEGCHNHNDTIFCHFRHIALTHTLINDKGHQKRQ